jgi:hypothetical protein
MTKVFTFLILLISVPAFGQKYMIHGNDTLPYKDSMVVTIDTLRENGTIVYKADTTLQGTCRTFEKINGQIVNQTDDNCRTQGLWIITDSIGNYSTGFISNNRNIGIWKHFYFDKGKHLIKETESVYFGDSEYIVKETKHQNKASIVTIDKPVMRFISKVNGVMLVIYCSFFPFLLIILIITLFIRIFINNEIYNIENGTDFPFFGNRFKIELSRPGETKHNFLKAFTFWFFRYKPENRRAVLLSNSLSVIFLLAFTIVVIEGMVFNIKPF